MDYVTIVTSLLAAAAEFYKRAQQEGQLSDAQQNEILSRANSIFDIYENAPPPPPPLEAGP